MATLFLPQRDVMYRIQRLIGVLMKGKPLIIWKAMSSSVMLCSTILLGQMFKCVGSD